MKTGDEIPDWARSCPSGKQKFATAEDARAIIRENTRLRGNRRKKPLRGTLHAYWCLKCDAFHITSAARRRDGHKHNAPRKEPRGED